MDMSQEITGAESPIEDNKGSSPPRAAKVEAVCGRTHVSLGLGPRGSVSRSAEFTSCACMTFAGGSIPSVI